MLKKKDILLIITILCVALIGLIAVSAFQSGEGALVTVTISGEVYGTYALDQDQIIEIGDAMGHNTIVISDGYVSMQEADCPDQYCVEHAAIHNNHETVICLPHELVVEISGGETSDVDAVAQ